MEAIRILLVGENEREMDDGKWMEFQHCADLRNGWEQISPARPAGPCQPGGTLPGAEGDGRHRHPVVEEHRFERHRMEGPLGTAGGGGG